MSAPTPLLPAVGTCIAELTLVVPNPTVLGSPTLEYLIGSTTVMGPIAVPDGLTTIADIQALIDGDATYIAYKAANPGFSITVTSFTDGALVVIITKSSSVQITDNASGVYNVDVRDSSAFVCNLAPNRHNRGIGGIIDRMKKYPQRLCLGRKYNPINTKEYLPCPKTISYYGVVYDLVSSDNQQCCYEKRSLFTAKGIQGTVAGQTKIVLSPGSRIIKKETFNLAKAGCTYTNITVIDNQGNQHFYREYHKNGFVVSKSDCEGIY